MLKSKIKKLERKLQPKVKDTGLENLANADVIIIDSLIKFFAVYGEDSEIKPTAKIIWDIKFRRQFIEAFADEYPEEVLKEYGIKKPEKDEEDI